MSYKVFRQNISMREVIVDGKIVGAMSYQDDFSYGLVYALDDSGTIGIVRNGKFIAESEWHNHKLNKKIVDLFPRP